MLRQAVKYTPRATSPYTTMAVTGRYHCSRFVDNSAAMASGHSIQIVKRAYLGNLPLAALPCQ